MAKKPTKTLITFLLDKSGSMSAIKDSTIEAFNGYVDGLKNGKADIAFTLVQFDSWGLEKTYVQEPIAKVAGLTDKNFQPRASTPLIDASYKTIKAVEKAIGDDTKTKVIICIQTDGEENSSSEHTWLELNALIKEKIKLGWEFNFLGAGIDAYKQGSKMGIGVSRTMSYNSADAAATRSTFATRGTSHGLYAMGMASSTAFTADEKLAGGDKFDPGVKSEPKPTAKKDNVITMVDDLDLS